MKTIAALVGLTIALSASAADDARAVLVGQRIIAEGTQTPILVCEYSAATVRYEVVAAAGACAPYLPLSKS
jgi:hypothetical protein